MKGEWFEVVRLRFKGKRFQDHALALPVLGELSQFQNIVTETAKTLWKTRHPKKRRLPDNFEEHTRLYFRKIEDGSTTLPLEVFIEDTGKLEFLKCPPEELTNAIEMVHDIFAAVEHDKNFPEDFPRDLLSEYSKFGQSLCEEEEIELSPSGSEKRTRITQKSSAKLAAHKESIHENLVEVSGEVLEADVKRGSFQLWFDETKNVSVIFSAEQEEMVTTALKDHQTRRMKVKGIGEYSARGVLLKIREVHELTIQDVGEIAFDKSERPIEEILEELAAEVPAEEWEKLPEDLNDNLDHYIYGTPKE